MRPTLRLCAASLATGVLAGLGGVALTWLLHAVQFLAFGALEHDFRDPGGRASPVRRVLALALASVVVGVGWWGFRRRIRAELSVEKAVAAEQPRLPVVPTWLDASLQIVAVGAGASIGREGAPRQVGAAFGSWLGRLLRLDVEDLRVLLAVGAGAGLGAVYDVPLAGAAFGLEATLAWRSRRAVVPALLASGAATATAWPFLGHGPVYRTGATHVDVTVLGLALLCGVVCGGVGVLFREQMSLARREAAVGWGVAAAMPVAFVATGLAALALPQVLGNGKAMAQAVFDGAAGQSITLAVVLALLALKPAATSITLRTGAVGGLIQPSFSMGAGIGFLLALLPGAQASATELVVLAAAVTLGVAQRMPITGLLLGYEFCHTAPSMLLPLVLAVGVGWCVHLLAARTRVPEWLPRAVDILVQMGVVLAAVRTGWWWLLAVPVAWVVLSGSQRRLECRAIASGFARRRRR